MSLPDLPLLVAAAAARLARGTDCGRHSADFLAALRNTTLWAAQMYDASVKAPWGVLYGSVYQLGHFDQCLSVQTRDVRGQYCLPSLRVEPLTPQPLPCDSRQTRFLPEQSAWLKVQFSGDPIKIRRDLWWWALCVPASCSPAQTLAALRSALAVAAPRLGVRLHAELPPQLCSSAQDSGLPPSSRRFLLFAAALIVLVIVATTCDVCFSKKDSKKNEEHEGLVMKIITLFSVQRNIQKLTYLDKRKSLQGFNIIYAFLVMAVMVGHRYFNCFSQPMYNGESGDLILHSYYFHFFSYGTSYVNIFFAKSGFYLAYLLSEELEKNMRLSKIFASIVNRYVRLTPLYILVILFYVYLFPYVGSGPLWKNVIVPEQEKCINNWWTNIMYLNNYIDPENMCIMPSWYLSAEFQLHVLGSILIYIKWRFPKIGLAVTGMMALLSIAANILLMQYKKINVFFSHTPQIFTDVRKDKIFLEIYISSFSRLTPYLIGVTGGLFIYEHRSSSFKLTKTYSYALLSIILTVMVNAVFAGFVLCPPDSDWQSLNAAVFYLFLQIAFSFIICGISALLTFGDTGLIQGIMTSKFVLAMSQLGYATYLIHGIPTLYEFGSRRLPLYLTYYNMLWSSISDYCVISFAALVLYLTVEAPLRSAIRLLRQK